VRFIADRTLGKLAKKLRVLGFDVVYWRGGNLEGALKAAASEGRTLLTRSRRVQEKTEGLPILVVEANDPQQQILEVLSSFKLRPEADQFFSRCLMCNEALVPIPKGEAEGKVPDFILRTYDSFHICPRCRRIYWPGTHFQRMKKEMAKTTEGREA
jgi:uncharacterized protein with PIN domain